MKTPSVEVKLLGQKVAVRSLGDPELVHEVAELVGKRLREAEARSRSGVPHHVALLALFGLAEDFLRAQQRFAEHQAEISAKTSELTELISTEWAAEQAETAPGPDPIETK